MALSATFTANFASFYDAVGKADKKLADFGAGADKVGTRLDRMTNQFSGVKVIQEASLMVKAIGGVEGVASLTEKEMARLGTTTSEAVEKMRKLGMTVPKDLQQVADATKQANTATTDWLGTLTKMAGAVGIAFSVDAIVGFIGSVFDAASAVKDLSDQWGVSTTKVQQWTGAAKQSGVEAQTVGKSVQFLTEKLGEGSTAYQAMLANVGLSYEQLRQMPLEDAYEVVVQAIAGIKDETLQLDAAQALLGTSSKKMVGAIRDGFLDAAAAQVIMSEETIARLEAAEAQWGKFKNAVIIHSGEMLAAVQVNTESMTSSWSNFFGYMGLALVDLGNTARANAFLQARQSMDAYGKSVEASTDSVNDFVGPQQSLNDKVRTSAQVLADLKAKEEGTKRAQEDRAAAQDWVTRSQDAYNKSLADYDRAITDLASGFAGNDLLAKANLYQEALKESIPIQQMTRQEQDAINKVMVEAIDVYHAAGQEAPQAMWDIRIATQGLASDIKAIGPAIDDWKSMWPSLIDMPVPQLGGLGAKPKAGLFDNIGKDLAGSLSKSVLSAIQGGGNIFQAAGSTIGNYLLDPKQSGIGKAIEGASKKLPGLLGGAISSAIPVVGSFIGPAIGWLSDKISGWFGKKEHEKLRDSFVKSAGGMTALRTAAEDAGVSLDNLMRARSTEKVQAAIGVIEEALTSEELRDAFIETSGGIEALRTSAQLAGTDIDNIMKARSTEEIQASMKELEDAINFQKDAYEVALEAAERYGFTIQELGPAMAKQELDKQAQQLYKDWEVLNSAGIDTIAITGRMSESVSKYVQDAAAMGQEIPAEMRPMLEAFVKAGTLLDANGEAITDLEADGVSFSMTMSEGFKGVIDEVKRLTEAIGRSLGLAIKNVPDIEVEGKVEWDVPPVPRVKSSALQGGESYQHGTHGFKNFGTGTPVVLHGWEAVVPRDESRGAFATVHGTSGSTPAAAVAPSIIINAQGAFFDTPESLQRLATKVSDALTAKFSVMSKLRAAV